MPTKGAPSRTIISSQHNARGYKAYVVLLGQGVDSFGKPKIKLG
jgi:hypothetical protein